MVSMAESTGAFEGDEGPYVPGEVDRSDHGTIDSSLKQCARGSLKCGDT